MTRIDSGADRHCAPGTTTQPIELTYTAPDVVTLSTIWGGNFLGQSGKITADGRLTFATYDTAYSGRFDDPEHFSLTGALTRRLPESNTCSVRISAYRYPGPRVCEVTTEDEEAVFAKQARALVAKSSLGLFKAFFDNLLRGPNQLAFYAIAETQPGEYAQTATGWAATGPAPDFRFRFNDGFIFVRDATFSHFSLTHPDGPALVGTQDSDSMRMILDEEWVIDFGPEQMDILTAPSYTSALIAPVIPNYWITGYSTPIGSFRSIGQFRELNIDMPDLKVMARITTEATTLQSGNMSKTLTPADRRAFCPFPGLTLFDAFPNVLQDMGYCTTTHLYLGQVQCDVIGP